MTKKEFNSRIEQIMISTNRTKKMYKRLNQGQLTNAYIMIVNGYTYKEVKKSCLYMGIKTYYALFKLMNEWQRKEINNIIPYIERRYWQTEEEMIIPNYTYEGLSDVEKLIYNEL
jgi:hypothetical protein